VALGALVAGAFLWACGAGRTSPSPSAARSDTTPEPPTPSGTRPGATASPSSTPSPSPVQTAPPADLVVAHGSDPETLVRRAIAALGGMERFVPAGAVVVIKPNICVAYRSFEYAATTNPWVVGTLVKMALEAGAASVSVFDYPYGGSAADAYRKSGIGDQVTAAGGRMVVMASRNFVRTPIPAGKWLKQADVFDQVLKADVVINAPIVKEHGSSRMTAGMKNLMGVVLDRPAMHGNLGQAIADLGTLIKPRLTVVDAVRVLTANGPSGGRLADVRKMDTVVASADPVAADSYAAGLLGLKPSDLAYVRIGTAMGLGRSDLSALRIEEISV
jgi:uncharacterized protein (DUF362 family)